MNKHFSLLVLIIGDKEKKFYNVKTSGQSTTLTRTGSAASASCPDLRLSSAAAGPASWSYGNFFSLL